MYDRMTEVCRRLVIKAATVNFGSCRANLAIAVCSRAQNSTASDTGSDITPSSVGWPLQKHSSQK